MIPTLTLIACALSLCVGALGALAIVQAKRLRDLNDDIITLWEEVFGSIEDEPDPGDEADVPEAANVVSIGRAA